MIRQQSIFAFYFYLLVKSHPGYLVPRVVQALIIFVSLVTGQKLGYCARMAVQGDGTLGIKQKYTAKL